MDQVGHMQQLIENYRFQAEQQESTLAQNILNDYEHLLQLFKQQNDLVNRIWDVYEQDRYEIAQNTLDPLEQVLYSTLLSIGTLEKEVQSSALKDYLDSLKEIINENLNELKHVSIDVYPICIQDLGAYGAIKSQYEMLKETGKLTVDVSFEGTMKRQQRRVELLLFRSIQYLIKMTDKIKYSERVMISLQQHEQHATMLLTGDQLVAQLQQYEAFSLFSSFIEGIQGAQLTILSERQLQLDVQL